MFPQDHRRDRRAKLTFAMDTTSMVHRTLLVEEQALEPPDGGWGWVIVFAGFLCHFVIDGIVYSSGVFFDEFLTYFGEGHGVTSWIASILMGSYLMSSKNHLGTTEVLWDWFAAWPTIIVQLYVIATTTSVLHRTKTFRFLIQIRIRSVRTAQLRCRSPRDICACPSFFSPNLPLRYRYFHR